MAKKMIKLRIAGLTVGALSELRDPRSLDIESEVPVEQVHEMLAAERRIAASGSDPERFSVRVPAVVPGIPEHIPSGERTAEELVTYRGVVIVSSDGRVLHGHETVRKALAEGAESVSCLCLTEKLTPHQTLALKARYAAKEGKLNPTARMELVRVFYDELGFSEVQIQAVLVGPKGDKMTPRTIKANLFVGRLFAKYAGVPLPFTNIEIADRHYSNLLRFAENNVIRDAMELNPEHEQHFVNMAIQASENGIGRIHDDLPAILKHEDTKDALFKYSFSRAQAELRAKYPEDEKDVFPLKDLQSLRKKFDRADTRSVIRARAKQNRSDQLLSELKAVVGSALTIDPAVAAEIADEAIRTSPAEFISAALRLYPDMVQSIAEDIAAAGAGARKAVAAVRGLE